MTPRIAAATAAIIVLSLVLLFAGSTPGQAGSPFVVNGTGDASDASIGNNVCATAGAVCTQRAAMEEANAAPEIHDIYYNLPDCPGAGCEINVASALPSLTRDFVTIDGSTQPGYTGEPLVVIDGGLAGVGVSGIRLEGSSTTVKGLEIRDFSLDGIIVGQVAEPGPWTIRDNLIALNDLNGVNIGFFCLGETTLTGNSILDNDIGIYSCGPNIIASFNRFFSNTTAGIKDEGFSEVALAENNWWGCNEGPATGAPDCDVTDGAVIYDPWLTLSIKAVPNSIPGGGTSNLSGLLVINSDGTDTSGPDWVLDGTPMTFKTDLGSVGSQIVFKETNSGGAGATLTADEGPGTANISVAVDLEEVATTVEITSAPPTPTPTPSPTPTPTASPTPTPTGTPGPDLTQGDVDCDGDVDGSDGAKVLAHVAGLGYSQQPDCPAIGANVASLFGDVNCIDGVNALDALAIFAHVAGLIQDNGACPDIGGPL